MHVYQGKRKNEKGTKEKFLTSTTSAVGAVLVASFLAGSDNFTVDVLGVIRVDVSGTAAAV